MSIIAYICGLLLMGGAMQMLGTAFLNEFLDLHSILIILCAFGLGLLNFSWGEFSQVIRDIWKNTPVAHLQLQRDLILVKMMWRYHLYMLIFTLTLNIIQVLLLGDDINSIGHVLAVILVSTLYFFVLRLFVWKPLEVALDKKCLLAEKQWA